VTTAKYIAPAEGLAELDVEMQPKSEPRLGVPECRSMPITRSASPQSLSMLSV
jgi:hypothetical protein